MTDDRDRAEMRALCDQFRREMARENDVLLFDPAARARIGQMIGRAALAGSEYGYPSSLGLRISVYRLP
jgi:hypothetical protein